MNQNEMGKKYQTYLLKEFFSDKPLFNVPQLSDEEQSDMEEIKANINPNVKSVIEESVQDATKSFTKLDNAVKNLHEAEEQMEDVEDISIYGESNVLMGQVVCAKVKINHKNKKLFRKKMRVYCKGKIEKYKMMYQYSKNQ